MKKNDEIKQLKFIIESLYKLQTKISSTIVTLKLERDTHVPDLMTRIRILPSVAVVGQKQKVARFYDGDAQLQISIKFLPRTEDIYRSVKYLSEMIKKLPGVKTIAIDSYNKKRVSIKGNKIIF
tara:strand:- start:53 stop:424 length:372 start_codon:yes stop_codon:yes gene_type:complete